jgi:hypothetical protein
MIKTYENFIKKITDFVAAFDTSGSMSADRIVPTQWNDNERNILDKYNFSMSNDIAIYQSVFIDLKIIIRKIFIETVPGHVDSLFTVQMSDFDKGKKFSNFDDVEKKLKGIIPEEELQSKKFNL